MSRRISDTDHGYNDLMKRALKAKGVVDVGIFADKGAEPHDKLTVIEVAVFNEFGLGVPERSFIRAFVDENADKVKGWIRVLSAQIVGGKIDIKTALERLGLQVQAGIQKRIADGIPPPNAPATIVKKGSSKPLIDTGQMRSSVSWKIRP